MTIFTLNHIDDEALVILMDGEEIGQYTHDNDGWVGLEAAETLIRTVAERLGATIEVTYD